MKAIEFDDEALRQMFEQGTLQADMAAHFGCARSTVSQAVKRLRLVRPPLPKGLRRGAHPNWKGGRRLRGGYVLVLVGCKHPAAGADGYAAEHRLVASAMLGRPLSEDEIVHHINGDKGDNRPENLSLMTDAEHKRYHNEMRRLERNA